MFKKLPKYAIRKLTIGAASVLIGIAFAGTVTEGTAKAAKTAPAAPAAAEKSQTNTNTASKNEIQLSTGKSAAAKTAANKTVSETPNKPEPAVKTADSKPQAAEKTAKTGQLPANALPKPAKPTAAPAQSEQTSKKAASKVQASQKPAASAKAQQPGKTNEDKIDQTVLKKLAKDAKASDVKIKDEKLKSEAQYQERTVTVHYVYGHGAGMDSSLAGKQVFSDAVLKVHYVNTGTAAHPVWKFDSSYNKDGYANGYKIVSGSWSSLPTGDSGAELVVSTPDGGNYIPTSEDADGNITSTQVNTFVNPNYAGSTGTSSIAFTGQANSFASQAAHTVYYEKRSIGKRESFTIRYVDDDDNGRLIYAKDWQDNSGGYMQADGGFYNAFRSYDPSLVNPDWNNYYLARVTSDKADPSILRQDGNTPFIPGQYVTGWTNPNYDWAIGQEDKINGATFTIHLRHRLNQQENDVTRTINVSYPDNSAKAITQTVAFTRNQDTVTNATTAWQRKESSPDSWSAVAFSSYDDSLHTITITDAAGNVLKDSSGKNLRSIPASSIAITPNTPSLTLNVAIKNAPINFTIKVVNEDTGQVFAYANVVNASNDSWVSGLIYNDSSQNYVSYHDQYYFDKVVSSTNDPEIVQALRQNGDTPFNGSNADWSYPNWSWNSSRADAPHLSNQQIAKLINSTFTIYLKHKAATIKLTNPEVDRTYNGQAQTIPSGLAYQPVPVKNDLQLPVNVGWIVLNPSDLSFADENGNTIAAPTKAGTYHLILNSQGVNRFKNAASNFNWSYDPTKSYIVFKIAQAPATINISGTDGKTYDGQAGAISPAKAAFAPAAALPNGETLQLPTGSNALTAADFKWNTADRQAPINYQTGGYQIILSQSGIDKLKAANPNYDLTFTGGIAYTIEKANGQASLSGSGSKTYNGKQSDLPLADLKQKISGSLINHEKLNLPDFNASDFDWYDANGNQLASAPTKAGTYTIKINAAGLAALQAKNANYNLTLADNSYTYKNKAADAMADLTGSNHMTYSGNAVTIDNINAHGGSIHVTLTFPGATADNDSFTLHNGEYAWQTSNGAAPTDAGTYKLKLNSAGLTALQHYLNGIAGPGNVSLTAENATGSASFTIRPVAIAVQQTGSAAKIYDQQAGTVELKSLTDHLAATGSIPGPGLDLSKLKAADFDWYDASGNKLDTAPVDAGTYAIKLNDNGRQKLQNSNKNYSFDAVTGSYAYKITPAAKINIHYLDVTGITNPSQYGAGTEIKTGNATDNPGASFSFNPINPWNYGANGWSKQGTSTLASFPTTNQSGNYYLADFYVYLTAKADTTDAKTLHQTINYVDANGQPLSGYSPATTEIAVKKVHQAGQFNADGSPKYVWTIASSASERFAVPTIITVQGKTSYLNLDPAKLAQTGISDLTLTTNPDGSKQIAYQADPAAADGTVFSFSIPYLTPIFTLSNQDSNHGQAYNGQPASLPAQQWTVQATLPGANPDFSGLTAADFDWYQQNASGNWTKLDSAPTNAGQYQLKLNNAGLAKLQANNPAYPHLVMVNIAGGMLYTISQANVGSIQLSGQEQKTFDNHPGAIDPSKAHWQLPAGLQLPPALIPADFQWENAAGQTIAAPSKADTYQIKLSATGLRKFQQANPNYQISVTGAIAYVIKTQAVPDLPFVPDYPAIPNHPSQPAEQPSLEHADIIFVTPTGQVVLRLPKGVKALINSHVLTEKQLAAWINKRLPKGWQLPAEFSLKKIQADGSSAFITIVPVKMQTPIYFVLENGKIIKKAVWSIRAKQASGKTVAAFAKLHLPKGFHLAANHLHGVDLSLAVFLTVVPN